MQANEFDLIVIGAGSAGVRAARLYAQSGKRVAIIEKQYVGGTCVNVGCIPKKLFTYAAHVPDDISNAKHYGWAADRLTFNWNVLRDNVQQEVTRLKGVYTQVLHRANVTIVQGQASFVDNRSVTVNGQRLIANKILIATGAMPFVPTFPGCEHVKTSDDFFTLNELPKQAHVVGGGYIAVELAGILAGLGVKVTLVYRGDLFLKGFDDDARIFLAEEMRKKGIELRFNSEILKIQKHNGLLDLYFAGNHHESSDLILYATGRKPNIHGLGLEKTNVKLNSNETIVVNEHYQTTVDNIFAIGDVIEGKALTPVAIAQAIALNKYWQNEKTQPLNYENIATTVFSQPNVGTIGLSEVAARARFGEVDVYQSIFRTLKHTVGRSDEKTFIKLVVNRANDQVVGLHMVGQEAGEIIQGFAVAIHMGATKAQFDQTIGIHPTVAEEFVTLKKA